MKNVLKLLSLIIAGVMLFSSIIFASDDSKCTLDEQSTQNIPINYTQNELNEIRKVHNKVVKKGLCALNADGTIMVNADALTLNVDENMFNEYIASIENLNNLIQLGVVSFDNEFTLESKSQDEITEIIYARDQELRQSNTGSENRFDTNTQYNYQTRYVPIPDLAELYAYSMARSNKKTIVDYMSTIMIYNPSNAYMATIGFWVAKVMEGGDWDYKSVPGYSPYNKEWWAHQRYTTSVQTSEWFGNYNYGFTGRYLFSLSILLAGGDGVSIITKHAIDDQEDKDQITQGYNEASGI